VPRLRSLGARTFAARSFGLATVRRRIPLSGVLLGGVDLAEFGCIVTAGVDALGSSPRLRTPTLPVPGRPGLVEAGPDEYEERVVRLVMTQTGRDPADLGDLARRLQFHLVGRALTLGLASVPGVAFRGRLRGDLGVSQPQDRNLRRPDRQVELEIACADPFAYAAADTVVALSAQGASLPLGTAQTRPRLVLAGVTDALLVYRDAAGVERGRMQLIGAIPAGAPVTVDCTRQTIRRADGQPHGLTLRGSFLRFDPLHAVGVDGPFPTLSVSPAAALAEARYPLAWLSLA